MQCSFASGRRLQLRLDYHRDQHERISPNKKTKIVSTWRGALKFLHLPTKQSFCFCFSVAISKWVIFIVLSFLVIENHSYLCEIKHHNQLLVNLPILSSIHYKRMFHSMINIFSLEGQDVKQSPRKTLKTNTKKRLSINIFKMLAVHKNHLFRYSITNRPKFFQFMKENNVRNFWTRSHLWQEKKITKKSSKNRSTPRDSRKGRTDTYIHIYWEKEKKRDIVKSQ